MSNYYQKRSAGTRGKLTACTPCTPLTAFPGLPSPQPPAEPASHRGCLPVLFRLTWIFGGIAIIYCVLFVAQAKGGIAADILLWVLALAIVLVRFIDIKYLKGETRDNRQGTMKDWRRYALMMLVFSGILYALAKLIASKHWL